MTDNTNTKAAKLGEAGALRAEALHEARKVLAPVAIFGSGQTLDEDGVASLIELAEYIATGSHPILDPEDDDPEDDDEPGDLSVVAQVLDLADELGFDLLPWQERLIEQAFADKADDPAAPWGAARVRAVRRGDDVDPEGGPVPPEDDEPGDFAVVHPLTHREPSRSSVLIDRQGDGWEYSDRLNGWTMNGSLTAVSWGPGLAWGPFTITGAAPSVADDLAKWKAGRDPEPRRTATLVEDNGHEWEFIETGRDLSGWQLVRTARGARQFGGGLYGWDSGVMAGRVFTIRPEGMKR